MLGSTFLFIAACSNGGDGISSDDLSGGDPVLTGQLIDSAVSGVRYATATRSGVTDSEGRFEYLETETVSFYLGDLLLGEAQAAAVVSLFDLAEGVDPVVGNTLLKKAIGNRTDGPGVSTVINLAALLQTLDSDGNPDNGIEISADVAALFEPDSVNLNLHWQDFLHDRGFRQALKEAKASALLDGGRQIRKPWQAMAHLYASLGIDSKLKPVNGNLFSDASGFSSYSATQEFDAVGNQVHGEYDANGDGMPETSVDYTYDAEGNLVREFHYRNGDASSGRTYAYLYDAEGILARIEYDSNGDGIAETIDAYNYNDDGNLSLIESYAPGNEGAKSEETSTHESNADGWWWLFDDEAT